MARADRPLKNLVAAVEELRTAQTLRDEVAAARNVRERADDVELRCVAAARSGGVTWAEIGAVYGLTKQGAQQRFRAVIAPEVERLRRRSGKGGPGRASAE